MRCDRGDKPASPTFAPGGLRGEFRHRTRGCLDALERVLATPWTALRRARVCCLIAAHFQLMRDTFSARELPCDGIGIRTTGGLGRGSGISLQQWRSS